MGIRGSDAAILIVVSLMLAAILFTALIVPILANGSKEEATCLAIGGRMEIVQVNHHHERACVKGGAVPTTK